MKRGNTSAVDFLALQTFIEIAAQGSFSAAAETLHVTQPAASKRVAALEQELGIRLFDRIGRRVVLTEAGRTLLPRARRIIGEVQDSERAVRNLSGRVEGKLLIGTSHHVGLHRLPAVLRAFTERYPEVELDIRFLDSEIILAEVERGDLELGVATLPADTPPSITATTVWRDRLTVVANPSHPLTNRSPITPRELALYRAILPGQGTYTSRIIAAAFAPLGVAPPVTVYTNYLETIKMMVSVGLGWGVLPRQMLDQDVISLELPELSLERELGIVRNLGHTLSNAARAFLATVEAAPKVA